jgi:hypothetical protein
MESEHDIGCAAHGMHGRHSPMMPTEGLPRERPLGRWAFWCSLVSLLMFAGCLALLLLVVKYLDQGLPRMYEPLGWVVVPGLPIATISTLVLAVRALRLRRQTRWAAVALIIVAIPVPLFLVIRSVGAAQGG